MKLEIDHPAFVVAVHKGGRIPKPTVILRKAEFDLATVSDCEAPLAFRIHRDRGNGIVETRDIRSFRGRLFGEVEAHDPLGRNRPRPQTLEKIVAMTGRQHFQPSGILFRVIEALRNEVLTYDSSAIVPSGIRNGLSGTSKPIADDSPLVAACRAQLDAIAMDGEIAAQIERWRSITQRELDKYLTVDGVAYQFCGEPVYRIADDVMVHFPDTPDGGLLTFSYAAGNRDDAISRVYALADERVRRGGGVFDRNRCEVDIEVVDHDHVTWRAEERDFDRYARSVEGNLHVALGKLADGHRHIHVPRSVYLAWLDLRDFLETYNPADGVPDELEHLLSNAMDEWIPFRANGAKGVQYLYQPDEELNERMSVRFSERPISLPTKQGFLFRP